MSALEPVCTGRRSPREEEGVAVWEGEGKGEKKPQLCAGQHPHPPQTTPHASLGEGITSRVLYPPPSPAVGHKQG